MSKRKRPLKQYEIGIHVNEIWVYSVTAPSFYEAVRMIRDGSNQKECTQTHSLSGGPNSRKPVLYKAKPLKERN